MDTLADSRRALQEDDAFVRSMAMFMQQLSLRSEVLSPQARERIADDVWTLMALAFKFGQATTAEDFVQKMRERGLA